MGVGGWVGGGVCLGVGWGGWLEAAQWGMQRRAGRKAHVYTGYFAALAQQRRQ